MDDKQLSKYSDEDKKVAKQIIDNVDAFALITRIFSTHEEELSSDLIASKNNEELGEFTRAKHIASEKVKARLNLLKRLADGSGAKAPRHVPK